ncbi:hypothetical protein D9619_008514 [Psilocybe cf. subviscida]|uniref:Uncharacterized protein n=1 Tax=Psilocybe cf. subviscida TaxID=2480587 RepID=A0A8H5F123_9AGAR|nr:hypothetical protein D9619_008514 [Psilocybe cf. subviscida]
MVNVELHNGMATRTQLVLSAHLEQRGGFLIPGYWLTNAVINKNPNANAAESVNDAKLASLSQSICIPDDSQHTGPSEDWRTFVSLCLSSPSDSFNRHQLASTPTDFDRPRATVMNFQRKDKNSTGASPYDEGWSGATPTETTEERQQRMYAMEKAAERSRQIEHFLLEGKKALDKRRKGVKILLLDFQLHFAPKHFQSERPLWKIVIYLNIIGSIKTIFDALEEEYEPRNGRQANNASMRVYQRTRLGLSPLKIIESNILALLAPECKDSRDMVVKSGSGWKTLLQTKQSPFSGGNGGPRLGSENDPSSILIAQKDDIEALWLDDEVQHILSRRRPRLRQSPGFFMDDISRILTPDYVPTDYDILRARIRTMGVEEHYFCVEKVNAIVFLAPLLFNEFLEEDDSINRVEDSMLLWKEICENKLLSKAHIMDILAATLRAGVQVKRYVTSYDNQPNDLPHVTKYFRDKFRIFHRKYSPEHRPFICYETSAINIDSMGVIIASVRDSILHQHLRSGDMI